jgi:prepilin peptidase CpaA
MFAMESMVALPLLVVLVAVMVAAITDLWGFRLHNALTIPLLFTGLIYHALAGGTTGFAGSVLGVLVGAVPLLIPYAKGGMGAGDIKLMAGVGAWLGPWSVLHVLIVSGLATGFCAGGLLLCQRLLARRVLRGDRPACKSQPAKPPAHRNSELTVVLGSADRRWKAIPFGALVALGVVVTWLWIG